MRGDFMKTVSTYTTNINYYRDILRDSNPIRKLNFYADVPERYFNSIFPSHTKFDFLHENLLDDKSYCDLADMHYLNILKESHDDFSP